MGVYINAGHGFGDAPRCVNDVASVGSHAARKASSHPERIPRLARPLQVERSCEADREAMLAALRVALGLPRALPYRERQP